MQKGNQQAGQNRRRTGEYHVVQTLFVELVLFQSKYQNLAKLLQMGQIYPDFILEEGEANSAIILIYQISLLPCVSSLRYIPSLSEALFHSEMYFT